MLVSPRKSFYLKDESGIYSTSVEEENQQLLSAERKKETDIQVLHGAWRTLRVLMLANAGLYVCILVSVKGVS